MTDPTPTFDLIERFRRGDQDAFATLFEKYRRRLAVLIHYRLPPDKRHAEDVDEILQETFLAAFEGLVQFEYRSPGSFLNWLSSFFRAYAWDDEAFGGQHPENTSLLRR